MKRSESKIESDCNSHRIYILLIQHTDAIKKLNNKRV